MNRCTKYEFSGAKKITKTIIAIVAASMFSGVALG